MIRPYNALSRAEQSRDYNIDLLKIIACIAVVGLHTLQKDVSILNATLYYLCGFAVPIFFASSGAFLMNRKSMSWRYAIRKICLILRVVIIWNLLIVCAKLVLKVLMKSELNFTILTIPKEIIKSLVQKGTMWHFWYFGALILLYFILPFLYKMNLKNRFTLFVIAGSISVGLQVASIISGAPVQKNIMQSFRLWTWIFYFVGGGIAYHYFNVQKRDCRRDSVLLIAATVFILIYQNLMGRFVITETSDILHAEYFYDSIFTMVWVFLIFHCVKTLTLHEKITTWIAKIAPLTMGIYIVHPLIIKVCNHFLTVDTFLMSVALFCVVLCSSAIAAWVICKIPGVRCLIKL